MIHQFFGLREQPFGVTPDPRYLYLGQGHREALASMYYGIQANRGFLALIANPGMGKTTLLFHLLEKFRHSDRTAFLFQTQCSSRDLMRLLLAELDVPSNENDPVRMHEQFNRYLLEQSAAGRRVIIVIDEAQNLHPSVMETVRLLSNFETPRAKLLQIILAGQPQLAIKLAASSLCQLRQRIASFSGLSSLSPQEVALFIDHRLHVAGYEGNSLFSDNAKALIAGLSEGVPRNINSLCFGSLSMACALRQKTIDAGIVQEVFGDLDLQKLVACSQHGPLHGQSKTPLLQRRNSNPVALSQSLPNVAEARPSSPPVVSIAEAEPQPAAVVTLSSSRSILDTPSELPDTKCVRSEPRASANEPRWQRKNPVRLLLPRVIAFAAIILMVGNGATKVADPVVRVVSTSPFVKPEHTAVPENIVKVPVLEELKLPPTVEPEPHASPKLRKSERKQSSFMETRAAAPISKVKTVPLSALEDVHSASNVVSDAGIIVPRKVQPERSSTEDPAELWQRVKEGSTTAEIKLAALYLEGSVVEQDCKQAHLLLEVASRKGSKVANGLLNNEYLERCHE